MSNVPPNKRKQAGKSLKRIARRLGLPYHKVTSKIPQHKCKRGNSK